MESLSRLIDLSSEAFMAQPGLGSGACALERRISGELATAWSMCCADFVQLRLSSHNLIALHAIAQGFRDLILGFARVRKRVQK